MEIRFVFLQCLHQKILHPLKERFECITKNLKNQSLKKKLCILLNYDIHVSSHIDGYFVYEVIWDQNAGWAELTVDIEPGFHYSCTISG